MKTPVSAFRLSLLMVVWCGAALALDGPSAATGRPATAVRPDPGPYEHVTITSSPLAPFFAPLQSFLHDYLSVRDTIVLTDSIYAQQSGRDNPEKIRNFIRYAYQNWQTAYVLLGGDVEDVPTRKAYTGMHVSDPWYDTIACDQYYSCLDGTWDADSDNVFGEMHDEVDLAPEVYVGRASVSTAPEAERFVTKTTTYGQGGSPHRQQVLLAGFDIDSLTYAEQSMEYYDSACIQSPFACSKVYDSHDGNHADSVRAYLNQGYHYCIHADHGNPDMLGTGCRNHWWLLFNSDMTGLTNGFDRLTVFFSNACLIGGFDYYQGDCIMEAFMNAAAGGGVAAMTNSRFGWYTPGENPQTSRSMAFVQRYVERLFSHGTDPGEMHEFFLGKADLIGEAEDDTVYRWCMYDYNLLGEPALELVNQDGLQVEFADGPRTRPPSLTARPAIFSRFSNIEFELGARTSVALEVYDAAGRCVRTVVREKSSPGRHQARWDGKTDLGRDAPAGVYVIALKNDAGVSTCKVVRCQGEE